MDGFDGIVPYSSPQARVTLVGSITIPRIHRYYHRITDNDGQMNITVLPNTEKMRQTIENSKEEEEKCWKMTVSIMGQISINYELMTESEIQTLPCKKQMASEDAIRPQ